MGSELVVGLDIGERRIGVALASTIARLPSAHCFIDLKKQPDFISEIKSIINGQSVEAIVVGLPRDMSGNETEQTAITRRFAEEISDRIDLPIVFQDESATSLLAEERLKSRGKPYNKGDIDAESAAIILQDYLNTTVGRTA